MERRELFSRARKKYREKIGESARTLRRRLSSSRALPMSPGLPARSLDEGDTHQRLDPLESVRFHVSSTFQSRRILRDGGMTGRVWNDASQRPFHLGKGHSIGREKETNRNSGFGGEGRYSRKGTVRGPAQCRLECLRMACREEREAFRGQSRGGSVVREPSYGAVAAGGRPGYGPGHRSRVWVRSLSGLLLRTPVSAKARLSHQAVQQSSC